MRKNSYSSGLVSESFWLLEIKKIISLLNMGESWDDIKNKCQAENLLGLSREYRAKRVFGYIKNRLQSLEGDYIMLFDKCDTETQKLIVLLAIAKQNRLFFEFLHEVYREKVILHSPEMGIMDINVFFKNKAEQSEDIAGWSDVTLKRLRSAYMNFMIDAGLIRNIGGKKLVTPPLVADELSNVLIEQNDMHLLKAITGRE